MARTLARESIWIVVASMVRVETVGICRALSVLVEQELITQTDALRERLFAAKYRPVRSEQHKHWWPLDASMRNSRRRFALRMARLVGEKRK